MLNLEITKKDLIPQVLEGVLDKRWENSTIFNHYESPLQFMEDVKEWKDVFPDGRVKEYIQEGEKAYSEVSRLDINYDTLYKEVEDKVKKALITRGLTTALLYKTVEFSTLKTGVLSKQRAMMGRKDCYYKDSSMDDSKLFHDIFINLSYDSSVSDDKIKENSYALYALTKEVGRLIPIRVFVVNHVGTNTPSCYSYVLKKFGVPITPEEFLFFTSTSKRTFGFASYDIMNNGYNNVAKTGYPENTISIADFSLDGELTTIVELLKQRTNIKGLK